MPSRIEEKVLPTEHCDLCYPQLELPETVSDLVVVWVFRSHVRRRRGFRRAEYSYLAV